MYISLHERGKVYGLHEADTLVSHALLSILDRSWITLGAGGEAVGDVGRGGMS